MSLAEVGQDLAARAQRHRTPAVYLGKERGEDRDRGPALAQPPQRQSEIGLYDGIAGHPTDHYVKFADRLLQAVLGDERLPHSRELASCGRIVVHGLVKVSGGPVVTLSLGRFLPLHGDVAEQGFNLGVKPQIVVECAAQCRKSVSLGGIQLAAGQRSLGGGQVLRWPTGEWPRINRLPQRLDQPGREQLVPACAFLPERGQEMAVRQCPRRRVRHPGRGHAALVGHSRQAELGDESVEQPGPKSAYAQVMIIGDRSDERTAVPGQRRVHVSEQANVALRDLLGIRWQRGPELLAYDLQQCWFNAIVDDDVLDTVKCGYTPALQVGDESLRGAIRERPPGASCRTGHRLYRILAGQRRQIKYGYAARHLGDQVGGLISGREQQVEPRLVQYGVRQSFQELLAVFQPRARIGQ